MTVWMDAVDETFTIPPFDGKIFIKACRISDAVQQTSTEYPASSRQQEQQQQQISSRTSTASSRAPISKPPSSSETLLAFGSDDINEDSELSFHALGSGSASGSFMDSNNNDLIGLSSSEHTIQPIPKVHTLKSMHIECSHSFCINEDDYFDRGESFIIFS